MRLTQRLGYRAFSNQASCDRSIEAETMWFSDFSGAKLFSSSTALKSYIGGQKSRSLTDLRPVFSIEKNLGGCCLKSK